MTTIDEIRDAISMEARENAAPIECVMQSAERMGALWKVFLEPFQMKEHLDESLEGAAVWWPGPPKGSADILSVVPDEWQINLRFASGPPPQRGGRLKIYRPQFLESLETLWQDPWWSRSGLEALNALGAFIRQPHGTVVDPRRFPRLRRAQQKAFSLPQYDYGFLWGPPGTGKTTTIGMLVASYLLQFPESRILLLSTTNAAVDEAIIAVDNALKDASGVGELRKKCQRIGNHFLASRYADRRHLLPQVDEAALQKLVQLEATRPDPANVREYDVWKRRIEDARKAIRAKAKEILRNARLAAMTTTRAVFNAEDLREMAPYDLVIFDEASQVSVPHGIVLAPLGRSVVFAGDPRQLAPIVQSKSTYAVKWMGQSPFRYMNGGQPYTCFLNEQSRMAEPICRVVSNTFYDRELIVAERECVNPAWKLDRRLRNMPALGADAVSIVDVPEDGVWSRQYGGPIRKWSADRVADLVATLVNETDDITVLVPFRAQRSMIKRRLRDAGLNRISVSTVHRAQGSERHTVIFDPVDGASKFVMDDSIGPRLINVAISRAKARVVLMLSSGDRRNPLLDRIARQAKPPRVVVGVLSLEEIVRSQGFPEKFIGKDVVFKGITGQFKGYSADQQKLMITDSHTKVDRSISIPIMFPCLLNPPANKPTARPSTGGKGTKSDKKKSDPELLIDLAQSMSFPQNALGKEVVYLERTYQVMKTTADGSKLVVVLESGGPPTPLSVEYLKRLARARAADA